MNFKGKVAIVTGAGQGIGLEICKQLVSAGANVVLNDLDAALAEGAVAQLSKDGDSCIAFPGDCSDINLIQKMVDKAVVKFGKLDIVVANAGITLYGDFLTYPPESFSRSWK